MKKYIIFIILLFHLCYGCYRLSDGQAKSLSALPHTAAGVSSDTSLHHLEYPAYSDKETIIEHLGYTTCFNHQTLIPDWVAYELTAEETYGPYKRDTAFMPDPCIRGKQASSLDYRGSGYDRGHMAPAADMKWNKQAMSECFYLSNICPQNHDLNSQAWERVEWMGRRIAQKYGRVYIVCGPLFYSNQHNTIGFHRIAVPDAFFKALLIPYNRSYSAIAFIMPNQTPDKHMKEYACTVDSAEAASGLDLFFQLEDEEECEIESDIIWKHWGI
ncbi:MAG: DNA/RNA non-specific endonuclease [Bacteroidales bacterium]|nr:DNA/RNA non-specific endonuclease [Bacteroidales bacterium]